MHLIKASLIQFAAEPNCVNTALFGEVCDNCNGSAVMQILAYVLRFMTYGIGILAVIGIMTFGIKYLTSRGDEALATKARRHLFEVLIGVAVYVVSIFALGWLLPGNLTTTMLGGATATCPDQTETAIHTTDPSSDPSTPSEPTEPSSAEVPSGWTTGDRPRECGPGTPGDFQTYNEKGVKTKKGTFPLYTNSAGRTFTRYNQAGEDWSGLKLPGGSTMKKAGCTATSLAMLGESFASQKELDKQGDGEHIYPKPAYNDSNPSQNYKYGGSDDCKTVQDCQKKKVVVKIKSVIDKGGAVLIHACGSWDSGGYRVCKDKPGNGSSHYFLLVDYRIKNGETEYFFLNTGDGSWNGGKSGNGWGTFDFKSQVKYYKLYYKVPVKDWDCKVR